MISIALESPLTADVSLLMERHTRDMHAQTPPESIHMMDASKLASPNIWFFVMRDGGAPIGMGALKRINETDGEIKSMHILAERRGQGLSRVMLDHLVSQALGQGFTKLSLETGSQSGFAAARGLYSAAGFAVCGPFDGYVLDPNSVYMTRQIAIDDTASIGGECGTVVPLPLVGRG